MSETILVTGASGQLGRLVLNHLLETQKVTPARLVAGSREPTKLSDLAGRGIATRAVDFDKPSELGAAFAGIDTLLVVSTDALGEPGKRLAQHKAAVAAAQKAGVRRIAYTSMPNPEPGNPVLFAGDHYGTEQAIKESGLAYTIFRNGWYQENLLMGLPHAIASGKWFTSAGSGRLAHVAREDIARAIAAALASKPQGNATYTLTGSQAFDTDEIAALASAVTGKPVEVVHLSDEALLEGLKASGLPAPVAALLVSFDANTRAGTISDVTNDVKKLAGIEPRPLRAFLEDNKEALLAG